MTDKAGEFIFRAWVEQEQHQANNKSGEGADATSLPVLHDPEKPRMNTNEHERKTALGTTALINTLLQRIGVNLRKPAKTCFNCLQPEGLTDSSRWSRGKRGATTGTRRVDRLHPGRGARAVVPGLDQGRFWHPSGVQESKATFSGGRSPFAPERPPATICQPFGLEQRGACFRAGSKVDADALKQGVGGGKGTLNRFSGFLGATDHHRVLKTAE